MADISEDAEASGAGTDAASTYEPGTAPAPPVPTDDDAAASALKDIPTRDDIDFLRGSWQYPPSEVNTYIDQHRPLLAAVGFSPDEIDDYYGWSGLTGMAPSSNCWTHPGKPKIQTSIRKS